MRLDWTTPARRDLDRIWAFNAERSIEQAERVEDALIAGAASLLAQPFKGRPGDVQGTRLLSLTRIQYLMSYRVQDDLLLILRVWSTAERR